MKYARGISRTGREDRDRAPPHVPRNAGEICQGRAGVQFRLPESPPSSTLADERAELREDFAERRSRQRGDSFCFSGSPVQ